MIQLNDVMKQSISWTPYKMKNWKIGRNNRLMLRSNQLRGIILSDSIDWSSPIINWSMYTIDFFLCSVRNLKHFNTSSLHLFMKPFLKHCNQILIIFQTFPLIQVASCEVFIARIFHITIHLFHYNFSKLLFSKCSYIMT